MTKSGAFCSFALGLFAAASLIVLAISLIRSFEPGIPDRVRFAAITGAVAIALLIDLKTRNTWAIGPHRQTDRTWRLAVGPNWAGFMWGLDIGTGFTTIRVTTGFWLLVVIALLAEPSWAPTAAILSYAFGYLLGLTAASPKAQTIHSSVMRHEFPLAGVKTAWILLGLLWGVCAAIAAAT